MIRTAECILDGGLLLMDRQTFEAWWNIDPTSEFCPEGLFCIALDVKGKTDQIYDWPNEEWSVVWRRETQELVSRVNRGEIAVLVLHEGDFVVDFAIDGPLPAGRNLSEYRSTLHMPSGTLVFAELGRAAEDWGSDRYPNEESFFQEITLPAGWYTVSFLIPQRVPAVQKTRFAWTFGTVQEPAMYVRLKRSEAPGLPIKDLFHVDFTPRSARVS
jgi:hypothetical protein